MHSHSLDIVSFCFSPLRVFTAPQFLFLSQFWFLSHFFLLLWLLVFVLPQRQDARIIVGLFYETEARKVFCEVVLLVRRVINDFPSKNFFSS